MRHIRHSMCSGIRSQLAHRYPVHCWRGGRGDGARVRVSGRAEREGGRRGYGTRWARVWSSIGFAGTSAVMTSILRALGRFGPCWKEGTLALAFSVFLKLK